DMESSLIGTLVVNFHLKREKSLPAPRPSPETASSSATKGSLASPVESRVEQVVEAGGDGFPYIGGEPSRLFEDRVHTSNEQGERDERNGQQESLLDQLRGSPSPPQPRD